MSNAIEMGRKAVEGYDGFAGRQNAYECDEARDRRSEGCGSYIVTIDRDRGVTPFMLKCGNCGGIAHSKMYRVQDWLKPTHEWYRPESLDGVDPAYFDHISKGGLILRPLDGKPDAWLAPEAIKTDPIPTAKLLALRNDAALAMKLEALHEETKQKTEVISRQARRLAEREARK